MIDLNDFSQKSLETAERRMGNGANIKTDTVSMLKHCATEVVEAAESYNDYRHCVICENKSAPKWCNPNESEIKSVFASELADVVTCALIIAAKEQVDIENALYDCLDKNRKRADKEGDKL